MLFPTLVPTDKANASWGIAMIYESWGFTGNPFSSASLPANELGQRLLVGRTIELKKLSTLIQSGPRMATVEGLNGVGKTSIVNVASFNLYEAHLTTGKGPLYIPCRKIFQLDPNKSLDDFIDNVLLEVAQTLIDNAESIKRHGTWIRSKEVDNWINSPQVTTYSGGIPMVQFGASSEQNTGKGFERSGFRKLVTSWLSDIFKEESPGGVICTIDNLELLQSSETARNFLERLRDELFNIAGLRWVLCGALGIVFGVVSSPRLEGMLHSPIEIGEIEENLASSILTSRVEAYSQSDSFSAYLPLRPADFERLYAILNGNLRSVLSHADRYCVWVYGQVEPQTDEDKAALFETWLSLHSKEALSATRQGVGRKAMEIFEVACKLGNFSPSDFEAFGYTSLQALRPQIKGLEDVGILVSTQDETDKRRKTIQVTAKGWLVRYAIDAEEQA